MRAPPHRRAMWLTVGALVAMGCTPIAEQTPPTTDALQEREPPVVERSGDASLRETEDEGLAALRRRAEDAAVRLRVTGEHPLAFGSGSGFLIDERTVLTNRHVVEDARYGEVSTWRGDRVGIDGRVQVSDAHDLALIHADRDLPGKAFELATTDLAAGDRAIVVGYPGGGRVEAAEGRVRAVVEGARYGEGGDVLVISVDGVEPGSSGGPVLHPDGTVAGVIFALRRADEGDALAIPSSSVRELLR